MCSVLILSLNLEQFFWFSNSLIPVDISVHGADYPGPAAVFQMQVLYGLQYFQITTLWFGMLEADGDEDLLNGYRMHRNKDNLTKSGNWNYIRKEI